MEKVNIHIFYLNSGSVIASFSTSSTSPGAAQNLQSAVAAITSQPNAVNGIQARSVSVYGRTYYASTTPSESSSYEQSNNIPLIVGLVVGLVGGVLLIAGSIYGYKKYQKKQRGQRLVNDVDAESSSVNSPVEDVESTGNSSKPLNNGIRITRRTSITSPTGRLHTPLGNATKEQRIPSAAMSVTMLDHMVPHNHPTSSKPMPPIELIKFD